MFIQTEETPNPEALKFILNQKIMNDFETLEFLSIDDTNNSPLAKLLFKIDGVKSIFFGSNFITITKKNDISSWNVLKAKILEILMNYTLSGKPVILDLHRKDNQKDPNQDPLVFQIQEILNTRIRPAIAEDGGDIDFCSFENGVVYLRMKGSCSGCPSSQATLKMGIENLLKYYIPEVKEVREIEEEYHYF